MTTMMAMQQQRHALPMQFSHSSSSLLWRTWWECCDGGAFATRMSTLEWSRHPCGPSLPFLYMTQGSENLVSVQTSEPRGQTKYPPHWRPPFCQVVYCPQLWYLWLTENNSWSVLRYLPAIIQFSYPSILLLSDDSRPQRIGVHHCRKPSQLPLSSSRRVAFSVLVASPRVHHRTSWSSFQPNYSAFQPIPLQLNT